MKTRFVAKFVNKAYQVYTYMYHAVVLESESVVSLNLVLVTLSPHNCLSSRNVCGNWVVYAERVTQTLPNEDTFSVCRNNICQIWQVHLNTP